MTTQTKQEKKTKVNLKPRGLKWMECMQAWKLKFGNACTETKSSAPGHLSRPDRRRGRVPKNQISFEEARSEGWQIENVGDPKFKIPKGSGRRRFERNCIAISRSISETEEVEDLYL